jgi:hypothetical protein
LDLSRVRNSEWLAAAAGLLVLVSMFGFDWYEIGGVGVPAIKTLNSFGISAEAGIKAWESQGFTGTIANLVILAAALSGIALAVLAATSRTVALPVAASALTAQIGAAAVVMVVLRMVFQPGPNAFVDLKTPIFIALAGCLLVTYGGWRSMQEEVGPYSPESGPLLEGTVSPEESPLAQPPPEEDASPPAQPPPEEKASPPQPPSSAG